MLFSFCFQHNVAYQCKGLDQSNSVCGYEVNLSTNEKVITEKQNFSQIVKKQCWISRSSEGQWHDNTWWKGLDLSNIVCKYEVNPSYDKVITEIQNVNANEQC